MTTYQISCDIGTTDAAAALRMEIWLDGKELFNSEHVKESAHLIFNFEEDDADHELKFIMKNKTGEHTKISDSGEIISDARLTISNIAFDEIELKQIFIDHATYTHNFNGTQPETVDKFYGEMGCNGTVSLKFSTPIYLWILEHL